MTAASENVLAVAGTSTDVGKTIVTAALVAAARAAGVNPAVCKPAQTGVMPGQPGDLAVIEDLVGPLGTAECARYPDPLAPETAARLAGVPPLERAVARAAIDRLAANHDVTLVEGAGGVMVRLAPELTLLDLCADVGASVLVVVPAGLGALNHAELTVGAVRARGLRVAGLVIGSWPTEPDLAMRCNRDDLPRLSGAPVVGVIPDGAGALDPAEFRRRAPAWFDREWTARELAPTRPAATHVAPTAL
ncbi:dethiobiotin synthase [Gordonia tangerina]|uniref:ATP-dependent dethiobiotin synthetase BioD n=1 Tax=Gordonia tangerina TaxID=2911060 RepID=A0ABS9DGU2_9ACTN|nr:dethiobiotin synthase [Gordonia tangerina]MCF3938434.1 dethiobiotin synthase [Gordonia tangerina]